MSKKTMSMKAALVALLAVISMSAFGQDDDCEYDDCIIVTGDPEDDSPDGTDDFDVVIYVPRNVVYGDDSACAFGADMYPVYSVDEYGNKHQEGSVPCTSVDNAASPNVPN